MAFKQKQLSISIGKGINGMNRKAKSKQTLLLMVLAFVLSIGVSLNVYAAQRGVPANAAKADPNRRVALVIGNGNYKVGPLKNAINDARALAQTLQKLGFQVSKGENMSQNEMKRAIDAFGDLLHFSGVGLFYYAGHGMQVDGKNYLIPVAASIKNEEDVEYEAVNVGRILAKMASAQNRLNIVILDACRDNPLARGFRSGGVPGLASIKAPSGTIIAYATAPGSVASDGPGEHGIYTEALIRNMQKSGLKVHDMFLQVGVEVEERTRRQQTPWLSMSPIRGDFYLRAGNRTESGNVGKSVVNQQRQGIKRQDMQTDANQLDKIKRHGESSAKAGLKRIKNSIGMEFVLIPAGEFIMGSNNGDSDEQPMHRVNFAKPFYLQTTEVTKAQWRTLMVNNPSRLKGVGDDYPVEDLNWYEVQRFIYQLNQKEGTSKYRLPTESEWEYAARAGSSGDYCFSEGDGRLDEYAWYESNSGKRSHSVGTKKSNAWGLYDMHGNVNEWCSDWYSEYSSGAQTNPQGPPTGSDRIFRGGSCYNISKGLRSASRGMNNPTFRSSGIGFRVARDY